MKCVAVLLCVALVLSGVVLQGVSAATCRALALEGGGSRGAYYAGVIRGMVEQTGPSNLESLQWDVVTGISAGSIVGFGISLFELGDEDKMSQVLYDTAKNLDRELVYKVWPPGGVIGLVEGVTKRSGLFDTQPLRETIVALSNKFGGLKNRKLVVGATSITNGHLHTWNETVGTSKMIDAVMASSAIPGLFPDQKLDGQVFSDGGVIENLNVDDAVLRCLEKVPSMTDITLDIILSSGRDFESVDATDFHTLKVLERNFQVWRYQSTMGLVNRAMQAYPDVNFRYIAYPHEKIPGAFNFSSAAMSEFLAAGLKDGKNVVLENQQQPQGWNAVATYLKGQQQQ